MGLTTNVTQRVEIPHEPGEWMEFKKLSRRQLEDAERTRRLESYEELRVMGGELYEALVRGNREQVMQQAGVDEAEVAAAQRDPLTRYDTFTLLRHGIKAWSYDATLSDAARAELDDETAEWAAREILKFSRPQLFEDEEDEQSGNAGTPESDY